MVTMQTIKLRPMSETPERWPVCIFSIVNGIGELFDAQLIVEDGEEKENFAYCTKDREAIGWLPSDELKFEVAK